MRFRYAQETLPFLLRYTKNAKGDRFNTMDVRMRLLKLYPDRDFPMNRIQSWFSGLFQPTSNDLAALANAFGVSPLFFFTAKSVPLTFQEMVRLLEEGELLLTPE